MIWPRPLIEPAADLVAVADRHGHDRGLVPLTVALVDHAHRAPGGAGDGAAQLVQVVHGLPVDLDDAVAGAQPGGDGGRGGAVRGGLDHLADAVGVDLQADRDQQAVDEQQGDDEVGNGAGGQHDPLLPGRVGVEHPPDRGRVGRGRLGPLGHRGRGPVGGRVLLTPWPLRFEKVAVVLVRADPGDLAEAAERQRLDAVLGLAASGRPDGAAEPEEEALDLHAEQLGGGEVAALVEQDGQHQGQDEQQDAEQVIHWVSWWQTRPRAVYGPGRGTSTVSLDLVQQNRSLDGCLISCGPAGQMMPPVSFNLVR